MKSLLIGLAALLLAAPALAHEGVLHDGCAAGQEFTAGSITVTGAFSRATLPNAPVGAGYMTIANTGAEPDRVVGARSEAAPVVELHKMEISADGMMKMVYLEQGIEVPAGASIALAPGGLHIMFIGPTQPFKEGECVALTLDFEKAGPLEVQLVVGPVGADAPPGDAGR